MTSRKSTPMSRTRTLKQEPTTYTEILKTTLHFIEYVGQFTHMSGAKKKEFVIEKTKMLLNLVSDEVEDLISEIIDIIIKVNKTKTKINKTKSFWKSNCCSKIQEITYPK